MPKFFSHLLPQIDETVNLGASGTEFNDLYIDGTAHIDEVNTGGHTIGIDGSGHLAITGASTKDIIIDSADDIILDAGGNYIYFYDDGVSYGAINNDGSNNFMLRSEVQDKDIVFLGNDNGSTITALTLDMSAAGTATFNHDIKLPDSGIINFDSGQVNLYHTSANNNFVADVAGSIILDTDAGTIIFRDGGTEFGRFSSDSNHFTLNANEEDTDIIFKGNDGGSAITALTLDMSEAGKATFNSSVVATDFLELASSGDTGHVNSYVLMNATQSDARGAGVYMHNTNADKEFYAGVPYNSSFGEYIVSYQSTASHSEDTATTGNAVFRVNSSGLGTFKAGVTLTAGPLTISGDGSNSTVMTESGSGDFEINTVADMVLDAGGGDIILRDDGTEYGRISNFSTHLSISSEGTQDADIYFRGNDGGSAFTALHLDMSDAGKAQFNGDVELKTTKKLYFDAGMISGGGNTYMYHHADDDLRTYVGGVEVQKMTENAAVFSQNTTISGDLTVNGGDLTLGGTGRIQGVDTVSAATDAVNKSYVDNVTWMPTLNQNTTGSAASLSGLSYGDIVFGGETSYEKLSGNSQSSNKFLRSRGAANAAAGPTWETVGAADISGLGNAATLSTGAVSDGALTLANGDQIHAFVTTQTDTMAANTTGQAGTVATIAGLAPNTATTAAAQPNITSLGTLTNLQVDFINANASTITITDSSDTGDLCTIATTTHGATKITTVDDDAAAAHFEIEADGNITLDAAGNINLQSDSIYFTSSNADDPLLHLKNTTNDDQAARIIIKKERADGGVANGQNLGEIWFRGVDSGGADEDYAYIISEIDVSTNGQESGELVLGVAAHDGSNRTGFKITGGDASGVVDAEIARGSTSTTAVQGALTTGGTISTTAFTIPNSIGSAGQVLQVPSSGTTLEWATVSGGGSYTLPLAASGTRGGAQIGYVENGKNYPVELSSEKMFVNVPWTDTNTMGSGFIVQDGDGDNVTITEGKYLKFKEGSGNGININFTDTNGGGSNDPYDLDFNLNIAGLANDLPTNLFNHNSYIAITDSEDSDTTHKMLVGDVVDALAGEGLVSNGATGDDVVALKINPGVGIALDSDKVVVDLNGTTLAVTQADGLSINTSACYAADFKIGRAATAMHLDFSQSGYTSIWSATSGNSGTEEFRFTSTGYFHADGDISGFSTTIASDRKLKKNIRSLDQYGLNEVLKLKPVMYDWKNEERDNDNIGFIAQDVQEVIPELVNESVMLNGKENETKLGVEYNKMVAVLTKAIQEQQKQIDELKQIINGGSR